MTEERGKMDESRGAFSAGLSGHMDLSGRETARALSEKTAEKVAALAQMGIRPKLLIIRIGENEADISYERGILKKCRSLEMDACTEVLPENVSGDEVFRLICRANEDSSVHGVLLFRPLPGHMDREKIENALAPEKDIDGMTDLSMSGIFTGRNKGFAPCTAQACMEILDHYSIDCRGKRAVVIGRSNVIGKPAAMLLLKRNATVTVCHTGTVDLPSAAKEADILLAAAGRAKMVDGSFLRPGQVILDVGIHVGEDGRLCGDVDYEAACAAGACITPVPGGVGAVTSAVLADHLAEAALRQCRG